MLYQLGPLSINTRPFNVDSVTRDAATDYVPKPVLGAEPPMEYVGEGPNTWHMTAQIFPKVIGGKSELAVLHAMRSSGMPQFLLRGDGTTFGWVVIEGVSEWSDYLASDGVGKQITVDIDLRRSGKASSFSIFELLIGLLT